MKKIISLCLAAFISTGIFAAPPHLPDSSGKIKKVFHHDFPEVSNFKIYTSGNEYLVYFNDEENQSSGRVYYDADGNILQTYQYYSGEQLPPFIRAKIDKKYNGKSIFSVTEVTNSDQHYYNVILNDSKQMFIINADGNGNLQLINKYKRA